MAEYVQSTSAALTPKLWSKKLAIEALRATWIYKFMGDDDNSLLQVKNELTKTAGDTITYGLRMQLQADGVLGDATLEGDEEALTLYSDAIIINQLRNAVKVTGRMTQQRSLYDLRNECFGALRDWWAQRMDQAFFNQICGYVAQTNVAYTGQQACIAPDQAHYVSADAGVFGDENISSANIFNLQMLDRAKERARTLQPNNTSATTIGVPIRPIRIKGEEFYVAFLHPYQVTDLRTASTAAGSWYDIQKAAMTGGLVKDNPIFDGALGVYNGIILHEAQRITNGCNSSTSASIPTVRRAVLCGAQAAQLAFGRNSGPEKMDWNEETFDFGNQLGVAAGCILGIKKTTFPVTYSSGGSTYAANDFGTVVMSSYAVAHS
jgi:N4-gp56 family major capsid protein